MSMIPAGKMDMISKPERPSQMLAAPVPGTVK
jgi:hypothetical protein